MLVVEDGATLAEMVAASGPFGCDGGLVGSDGDDTLMVVDSADDVGLEDRSPFSLFCANSVRACRAACAACAAT